MKVTRELFLKATANAMEIDSTKKLFDAEPIAFDMFSLFSYIVMAKVENKEITEDDFTEVIADVIVESLPDSLTNGTMLKDLALVVFSIQIWNNLEKLCKPDKDDQEIENFKSVLKSKMTK